MWPGSLTNSGGSKHSSGRVGHAQFALPSGYTLPAIARGLFGFGGLVAETARQTLTVVVNDNGPYTVQLLVEVRAEMPALQRQPYRLTRTIRTRSLSRAKKSENSRPNRWAVGSCCSGRSPAERTPERPATPRAASQCCVVWVRRVCVGVCAGGTVHL